MLDLRAWREWRDWVPADCPGCHRRQPGQGLCADCRAALPGYTAVPRCRRCAHPLGFHGCPDCSQRAPVFDAVVMGFEYQGLGRDLVLAYKARGQLALADMLARQMAHAVHRAWRNGLPCPDWVVPVPARQSSLRRRGFNPPAELARRLARRVGLPCRPDMLWRVREGPRQATLGRAARLAGPWRDYACVRPATGRFAGAGPVAVPLVGAPPELAGACVAVVDDVMTTGATLNAVASALKAGGAARVQAWVLARAVQLS